MTRQRYWVIAALLVPLAAVELRGMLLQDQRPFRAETDLVIVTATVLDRDGKAVTNLTRSAFAVRENDTPQEIALFALDDRTPVSLAARRDGCHHEVRRRRVLPRDRPR